MEKNTATLSSDENETKSVRLTLFQTSPVTGLTINRTGPHRAVSDRTGPVFLVIVCLFVCECTAV